MQMVDSFHNIVQKNENENFVRLCLDSSRPLLEIAIAVAVPALQLEIHRQGHSACALTVFVKGRCLNKFKWFCIVVAPGFHYMSDLW